MPTVRTPRSGLRDRLGTYFLGIAIGCMMVMGLLMLRRAMLRSSGPPASGAPPAVAPTTGR